MRTWKARLGRWPVQQWGDQCDDTLCSSFCLLPASESKTQLWQYCCLLLWMLRGCTVGRLVWNPLLWSLYGPFGGYGSLGGFVRRSNDPFGLLRRSIVRPAWIFTRIPFVWSPLVRFVRCSCFLQCWIVAHLLLSLYAWIRFWIADRSIDPFAWILLRNPLLASLSSSVRFR